MAACNVCFHHCDLPEGGRGLCGARVCQNGRVVPAFPGAVASLALDPIEKKPLRFFHPGSRILSVGSFGCDLRCPFCQNHTISRPDTAPMLAKRASVLSPRALSDLAVRLVPRGNIGLAFTYNEPLVAFEFVRDTARLVHEAGLLNVLVTNGSAALPVLEAVGPYIDAMNIDLKSFSDACYSRVLGGSLEAVKAFIARAVCLCHVELTCLIVPGMNDTEEEMRRMASWIAALKDGQGRPIGEGIPLHVSRFFPAWRMTDRPPTDVSLVYRLADIAREHLGNVCTGNC